MQFYEYLPDSSKMCVSAQGESALSSVFPYTMLLISLKCKQCVLFLNIVFFVLPFGKINSL